MKISSKSAISVVLFFIFSHPVASAQHRVAGVGQSHYCHCLDTLVSIRKSGNYSNVYANKLIPKLEKISGIQSSANKGFFGYVYTSESEFKSDVNRWRCFFKCNPRD